MSNIVCLSGGKASAWVALWAVSQKLNPVLYFNDTKWEHPDLYRFIKDISNLCNIQITEDSDGRNPEQVFIDSGMQGSNRAPICSKVLKAKRLQKYAKSGDILFFGIGIEEIHRATRIRQIYSELGIESRFPIIENNKSSIIIESDLLNYGLILPKLYSLGFSHNNCNGGCVRAGRKQWAHLYRVLPNIYEERARVERQWHPYTFMKDISLDRLRAIIDNQPLLQFDDSDTVTECIGICDLTN